MDGPARPVGATVKATRGLTPLLAGLIGLAAACAGTAAQGPTGRTAGASGDTVGPDTATATVVLLHGLGRGEWSMRPLRRALEAEGYRAVNLGYPSREHTIATLADTLAAELARCCTDAATLHFVTHSLGGILVRLWVHETEPANLGRVVMLSPPNRGTEVVDRIPHRLLELVLGPASVQLGTDSASVPLRLPPASFELGIIAGDATLNPLFSWWLPGADDGVVAVQSTRVDGADDFLVVPYSHTFIMRRERVIEEVLSFLETGRFQADAP